MWSLEGLENVDIYMKRKDFFVVESMALSIITKNPNSGSNPKMDKHMFYTVASPVHTTDVPAASTASPCFHQQIILKTSNFLYSQSLLQEQISVNKHL